MSKHNAIKAPPTGLVQTNLPPDLHRWVKKEAKRAGLAVAAWLRSTLVAHRRAVEAKFPNKGASK